MLVRRFKCVSRFVNSWSRWNKRERSPRKKDLRGLKVEISGLVLAVGYIQGKTLKTVVAGGCMDAGEARTQVRGAAPRCP